MFEMSASGDKPASTKTYIIVGAISYVVVAIFLVAVVIILSYFYQKRVKSTTEAVASLNVNQYDAFVQEVSENTSKIEFYQDTLASGRPAPIDESQVVVSWQNGVIRRVSVATLDRHAIVLTANFAQPASAPIGRILLPAKLLGDPFPLSGVFVNTVYRYLKISIAISGVINFLEIERGTGVAPALAARIVSVTSDGTPLATPSPETSLSSPVSEANVDITPIRLTPDPIVGFSRAVPFNVEGAIILEVPDTADLTTPIARFGDLLQIIPVNFSYAQVANFKLAVSGQNWGPSAVIETTPPPTINVAEMFKLAA